MLDGAILLILLTLISKDRMLDGAILLILLTLILKGQLNPDTK